MFDVPYVSDVLAWKDSLKKSTRRRIRARKQTGGGLFRKYINRRLVHSNTKRPEKELKVQQVSPTVAIEDRAESELKQQEENKSPSVNIDSKPKTKSTSIKGKKSKKGAIQTEKSKRKGVKPKSAKPRKTKKGRRKIDLLPGPSIFERKRSRK